VLVSDRLPFFSKVMKGHSEQKGVPFSSPFLSKVTCVDVLPTGWAFKEEKQDSMSAC